MTPISLQSWMSTRNPPVRPEAGRLVVLATDGRSYEKDHPLGIGFMSLPNVSPEACRPPSYIFVQGADAEKALPYTGVSSREYLEQAVGEERFFELLRAELQGVEFFVSYWARLFIGRWFQTNALLQGLAGVPIFDVVEYVKLLEHGEGILPTTANNWEELNVRIQSPPARDKGYGFEAVYRRVTGADPQAGGEIFKNRLLDLHRLFTILLVR